MRDFFGCYLLQSKHPRSRTRTYIGFTVNPKRRIRQHNGVIGSGAWQTSKWRPWEMVLVVFGFTTQQVQALQFEWAWQHPKKSKAVRGLAASLGTAGMQGVKLMLGMLAISPWSLFPLTVQLLSSRTAQLSSSCGDPPSHLPAASKGKGTSQAAVKRGKKAKQPAVSALAVKRAAAAAEAAAAQARQGLRLDQVPTSGLCPACHAPLAWVDMLTHMLPYGVAVPARQRKRRKM
ncbi:hypothetical protein V8C86DRAFT_1785301 [Haematococcus lacustris]